MKELAKKYDIKKERIIKELVDIIDFNILDVQSLKKITEINFSPIKSAHLIKMLWYLIA
mgnify:CR=1 FL=1